MLRLSNLRLTWLFTGLAAAWPTEPMATAIRLTPTGRPQPSSGMLSFALSFAKACQPGMRATTRVGFTYC